jgi:hypothetical protein
MKRILIFFIVSLVLIGITGNLCFAENPADTGTAQVKAEAPETQSAMAEDESEGEITYSAIPETGDAPSVLEARICEGINNREPVAAGDVFSSDISPLFCFSRIKSSEPAEIKHIWYFNGAAVAEIPLSIGASSGWRTFSSKVIEPMEKGNWKVEIVTASGVPIKTIQFLVN